MTDLHHNPLESVFALRSRREVKELMISSAIINFAASVVLIFEPIYLYTLGWSVPRIISFFLVVYILYLVLAPLGGKLVRARGYEHGMMYASPFHIIYYLSLFAIPFSPVFTATAIIAFALQKTFYWPGFHADLARFGSVKGAQGKELGTFGFLSSAVTIAGPFVGGAIVSLFGFPTLFIVVAALILLSNVPLLTTPEILTPRPLVYGDAWKRLFKKENRARFFAYAGYAEEFVSMFLWPIFMFVVVSGFFALGAISSIATLATTLILLAIGRLTDVGGRHRTLRLGVFFKVLAWLLRPLAMTPLGILGLNALGQSANAAVGVPLLALTYEYARGYSVTKTALFFEMALVVGKVIMAILALAAFLFYPQGAWYVVFVLAAFSSLLFLFLSKAADAKIAHH